MAVTTSHLTASSGASASSFVTASISYLANNLALIAVGAGFGTQVPTVTGASLTWVLVDSNTSSNNGMKAFVFRAMNASNQSGALTIDFSGVSQNFAFWSVDLFAGVNTSGTNGSGAIQSNINGEVDNTTSTGLSMTLPSNPTGNATYGAVTFSETSQAVVAGSGYTEILNSVANSRTFEVQWRNNATTTVNWTWGSVSNTAAGVGIGIKPATVPGGFLPLL